MRYMSEYPVDRSMTLITAVQSNRSTVDWVTQDLASLVCRLRDVYMDKLADEIEQVIDPLRQSAAQVSASYDADLHGQINHGHTMMGGLLAVAIKMGEAEDRAEKAEAKLHG